MKNKIPSFVVNPSYDLLHQSAVEICKLAVKEHIFDIVVAPVRGGLIFGVIASHFLNIPLTCIEYSSKNGNGDNKNHKNILPKIKKGKTIFLIDDIADSGYTLKEIKDYYEKKKCKVVVATFHSKKGSVIEPDYYWWQLPKDAPFIHYPYESVL